MSEDPKINKLDELEMAFAFSDGMEDCQTYVSKRDGSRIGMIYWINGIASRSLARRFLI